MFRADGLTVFLSLIILSAAILTVMVSATYVEHLEGRMPIGEFYVLLAFSVLGALLITAAAGDLVMIFVGIELSSLATYVLTAFAKRRVTSVEGALKYFLLGIFASAILVYGMAWIYGAVRLDRPRRRSPYSLADRRRRRRVPRRLAPARPAPADRRPRLQDGGRPVPLLDAGRLRRRPDPGDRLHVGRAEGGRLRRHDPDPGPGPRPAARRLDRPDRRPRPADDGLRQRRRHLPAQRQADAGLLLDRPHRLHAGRPRRLPGHGSFDAGTGVDRRPGHLRAALLHPGLHLHEHRRLRRRRLAAAPRSRR